MRRAIGQQASMTQPQKIAVITGASSGIGEAAARSLARDGYKCYLGARRLERIQKLAAEIGGVAQALDVTELDSIKAFCAALPNGTGVPGGTGLPGGEGGVQ